MTLMEKFATLAPEQQEQFKLIKNVEQLDAFLADNKLELPEEDRKQLLEYFETGKLPLADEELENAAGGKMTGAMGKRTLRCM